jgi:WD40 repeat protein
MRYWPQLTPWHIQHTTNRYLDLESKLRALQDACSNPWTVIWKHDLVGHPPVEAIACAASGRWLCVACADGSASLWDLPCLFKKSKDALNVGDHKALGSGGEGTPNAHGPVPRDGAEDSDAGRDSLQKTPSRGISFENADSSDANAHPRRDSQMPTAHRSRSRSLVVETPDSDKATALRTHQYATPKSHKSGTHTPHAAGTSTEVPSSPISNAVTSVPEPLIVSAPHQKLIAHRDAIRGLTFNSRSDTLCTSSEDGVARVWKLFDECEWRAWTAADDDHVSEFYESYDDVHHAGKSHADILTVAHDDDENMAGESLENVHADVHAHGHAGREHGGRMHAPNRRANEGRASPKVDAKVKSKQDKDRRWYEVASLQEQGCEITSSAFAPTYSKLLATIGRDGVVCVYNTDLVHEDQDDDGKVARSGRVQQAGKER